jgi:hypothetical protein
MQFAFSGGQRGRIFSGIRSHQAVSIIVFVDAQKALHGKADDGGSHCFVIVGHTLDVAQRCW